MNTNLKCKMAVSLIALPMLVWSCSKNAPSSSLPGSAITPGTTTSESKPNTDLGIGPIKSRLSLEAVNQKIAAQGKVLFTAKCTACHKVEEKYVGPALKDVTNRRSPEWIMNMILNPAEMIHKDPIGKDLLAQNLSEMSFQNVTQAEAREIL